MRRSYQGISSLRLPDQISRNCENARYAQIITKASSRLPRSPQRVGEVASRTGGWADSQTRTMIPPANAGSSWAEAIMAPKMLEYQAGSSDMIQSTAAKVIVRP